MEEDSVEFTIRKIIAIDKDAENLRQNSLILLEGKRKDLEKELEEMERLVEREIAEERKRIMEEKLGAAMLEAETIRRDKEKQLNRLRELYYKAKEDVVSHLFRRLVESIEASVKNG
jgi:hypothetical protein